MTRFAILRWAIVLFIVTSAYIYFFDTYLQNETTPMGIISFEFIENQSKADEAKLGWGATGIVAAGVSLGLDYLYIVLYSIIACVGLKITSEKVGAYNSIASRILLILCWVFPMFAISDALENFSLIQILLESNSEYWPMLAFYFAIFKFTGVAITLIGIFIGQLYVFVKKRRT